MEKVITVIVIAIIISGQIADSGLYPIQLTQGSAALRPPAYEVTKPVPKEQRTESQNKFEEQFGDQSVYVLKFISGTSQLSDISFCNSPKLVGKKGYLKGEKYTHRHTLVVAGRENPIIFYTSTFKGMDPNRQHDFKLYLNTLIGILRRIQKFALSPKTTLINIKREPLLLMLKAEGKPLNDLRYGELDSVKLAEAAGFALGKLHGLGVVHGDLWRPFSYSDGECDMPLYPHADHIFVQQDKYENISVSFIDYDHAFATHEIRERKKEYYDFIEVWMNYAYRRFPRHPNRLLSALRSIYWHLVEAHRIVRALERGHKEGVEFIKRQPAAEDDAETLNPDDPEQQTTFPEQRRQDGSVMVHQSTIKDELTTVDSKGMITEPLVHSGPQSVDTSSFLLFDEAA